MTALIERARVRVRGRVQGVGFRPHVFVLARRLNLDGFVRNDEQGVLIEAEGPDLDTFVRLLLEDPPPLARIDSVEVARVPTKHTGASTSGRQRDAAFEILSSERAGANRTMIPSDISTCEDCLRELFDPFDRRYLYPFINCTHCGPRFTITQALPYDRPNTSMARFPLCGACHAEYEDPHSRRFHAEPIACPACGPKLSTTPSAIAERLRRGHIVALKGLGGFHLAVDAANEAAVAELRRRKQRDKKPFALMVANAASALRLTRLSPAEQLILESSRSPVVLLERRSDAPIAASVAFGLSSLGVMLPYTPLHHLLFHELARPGGLERMSQPVPFALVMTSANLSDEPLVISNEEAERDLASIADLVVTHDRDILSRADDSVVRVLDDRPIVLRRARGWCPDPVRLTRTGPPMLGLGAELKSTFTITRGDEAFVSPHLGDLDRPATIRAFREAVARHLALLEVVPELIAHDLHPDFASTLAARTFGRPTLAVQHHHAHAAAVLAEHGEERALALVLDGFGFGADQTAWGGELLRVEGATFERWGHLAELLMPGGEASHREPWRLAAAVLHHLDRFELVERRWPDPRMNLLSTMLERRISTPVTTAAGRWFDAAAAIVVPMSHQSYEAEAAMRLESLVTVPTSNHDFSIENRVLDLYPLFEQLVRMGPTDGANSFHGTLAHGLAELTSQAMVDTGMNTVVIAGGCVANRHLTRELERRLESAGARVLLPIQLPPGDGAISVGQAWVAQRVTSASRAR
ncbi:MAG: carbamoyltransferase HypF [Deltaproteobacteria bacterium]|nr:carbamoyltransferase HypF [Deltaproteobacteria bacterium]